MEYDSKLYWIWLSLIAGAGGSAGRYLIEKFGMDIEKIYKSGKDEYSSVGRLKDVTVNELCNKDMEEAKYVFKYCIKSKVEVLTIDDPKYPKRLAGISNPPLVLYYMGELPDIDDNLCIATVGTRNMTHYGEESAYKICYDLAKSGAVVVSGMAKGIDSACHNGCIDGGGHTIAVFGCGIDVIYPSENHELAKNILRSGTLLTEFKPGTKPNSRFFPIRNRIISGLCQGTFVVEADIKSGALITAKFALSQGRDLFALPGKVGETNSVGTNKLIKDGAVIVTSSADIIEKYEEQYSDKIDIGRIPSFMPKRTVSPLKAAASSEPQKEFSGKQYINETPKSTPKKIDTSNLNDDEKKICSAMEPDKTVTCDVIIRKSGLSAANVMTLLTSMELYGVIKAVPGGYIKLTD